MEKIRITFGKYKGTAFEELDSNYLEWLSTADLDFFNLFRANAIRETAKKELERRSSPQFNFNSLNEEQLHASEVIKSGSNVLLTGAAGCGKSYLVKQIANTMVLCPTGISAINADGKTYHSAFAIDFKDPLKRFQKKQLSSKLVVLDEIFYVQTALLDNMFKQIPQIKNCQIIMTGDPYQLAPIAFKTDEDFDESSFSEEEVKLIHNNLEANDKTLFDVLDSHGIKFESVELLHSVRHKNDLRFANALTRVRKGEQTTDDLKLLNTRHKKAPDDALILTFRRALMHKYNEEYLKKFDDVKEFEAVFVDHYASIYSEADWYKKALAKMKKAPKVFRAAVGCNVVINYNDAKLGFVNGDLGTIKQISDSAIYVTLKRNDQTVRFTQNRVVKGKDNLGYYNFGLQIAKAMTIHKSQGCTISGNIHLHIDSYLAKHWRGAVYTALSRVGTLEQFTLSEKLTSAMLKQTHFINEEKEHDDGLNDLYN